MAPLPTPKDSPLRKICVFCGSSPGSRPEYVQAVQQLADHLADRGLGLVYGGGKLGLMGTLADRALQAGVPVSGVIPERLKELETAHGSLDELYVIQGMHERKAAMSDLADGFIVLPGGYGTMEEFFEIVAWSQLGFYDKRLGLLNVANYFEPLLGFLDHAVKEDFLKPEHRSLLIVHEEIDALVDAVLPSID